MRPDAGEISLYLSCSACCATPPVARKSRIVRWSAFVGDNFENLRRLTRLASGSDAAIAILPTRADPVAQKQGIRAREETVLAGVKKISPVPPAA